MDSANLRIINDLKKFLMEISNHRALWRSCVVSEKSFTRNRCLPFSTLVLMILNLPKQSLNIEVKSFFAHIQQKSCGKSAFCMQRTKLQPLFFQLWNRVLVERFYHHYGERVKRWKGFVLLAFDGSIFSLPNTKELCELYGQTSSNKGKHGAVARCCVMYDVLNKLIIEGNLVSYLAGERSAVLEQLKHASQDSLLTFDRGYPGFWLFYLLSQKQQCKFVMRSKLSFNNTVKAFLQSSDDDRIEPFAPDYESIKQLRNFGITVTKQTNIPLRMVKIPLKTGETEVLITNLYSSDMYSIQDLKEVYALRWGVETCFNVLKNQLQIENFSGIRSVCVEQDFFANLFVYNLQSIIEKPCQSEVLETCKSRKHNYQINKKSSWVVLKNRMVDLFLKKGSHEILLELQALFQQHLEPVRPNRNYHRKRKRSYKNRNPTMTTNCKQNIYALTE